MQKLSNPTDATVAPVSAEAMSSADPGAAGEDVKTSARKNVMHPLARYLILRALLAILLMIGVTIVTFTLTNLPWGSKPLTTLRLWLNSARMLA